MVSILTRIKKGAKGALFGGLIGMVLPTIGGACVGALTAAGILNNLTDNHGGDIAGPAFFVVGAAIGGCIGLVINLVLFLLVPVFMLMGACIGALLEATVWAGSGDYETIN